MLLVVLIVMGIALVAVAALLGISLWKLVIGPPSRGVAVCDLVVAVACGLNLARAIYWVATDDLLPSEWKHVAVPAAGLVIYGLLGALHFLAVRRDPSRL